MLSKPQFVGEYRRVKLSEICSKGKSSLRQKDVFNDGPYSVYGASGIVGTTSEYQNETPYVVVVKDGAGVGRASACEPMTSVLGTMQALIPNSNVERDYLLHLVRSLRLGEGFSGSTIPHIYFKDYGRIEVPLPSLEVQKQIVSQLGLVEAQITQVEAQIEQFDQLIKSRFDEMFGDPVNSNKWPRYKIGDVYAVKSSKRIYAKKQTRTGIPFYRLADINTLIDNGHANSKIYISEDTYAELASNDQVPLSGDILVTARGTLGRCYVIAPSDCFYFQDGMITWLSRKEVSPLPTYLVSVFKNAHFIDSLRASCSGTTVRYLSIFDLANTTIPLPPIALQEEFVDFVSCTDKSRFVAQQQVEKLQMLYDSLAQEYFGD